MSCKTFFCHFCQCSVVPNLNGSIAQSLSFHRCIWHYAQQITTGQELHQVITNSLARVTERSLFMSLATQFQGNMIIPVETFVVWARSEQGEVVCAKCLFHMCIRCKLHLNVSNMLPPTIAH